MERRRTPRPVIPYRLPSGRGATEQPNNTDEQARLSRRFWTALVLTGVAAGLFGALMMIVLHAVQHLAFGYRTGPFGEAVARTSGARRMLSLAGGGAVVGVAWYLLRRRVRGSSDVDDALWAGTGELAFGRSFGTGVISEMAIGAGASLGREAAPKLLGAAAGSVLARWTGLDSAQRRLLVACGGGAGMGAVYNVPLGGALITAELLYGQVSLPVLLPALVCSAIATAVSWISLPMHATYLGVPDLALHPSQLVFALLVGPVIGVLSVALIRLIGWVSHYQLRGRLVLVGPLLAFTVLGLLALRYPLLLGNGKDLIHQVFLAHAGLGLATLLALALLKPLVTVLCLGSGATGGLFTPVMSTGAVLGLLLGELWIHVWPGAQLASLAVIGASAMVGAAMQAPLAAVVLVLELTRTAEPIVVPMIVATAVATLIVRHLDGYSIYSARLPRRASGHDPGHDPIDALHA